MSKLHVSANSAANKINTSSQIESTRLTLTMSLTQLIWWGRDNGVVICWMDLVVALVPAVGSEYVGEITIMKVTILMSTHPNVDKQWAAPLGSLTN